jgi:hypothetical protein
MSAPAQACWPEANQRCLAAALAVLREALDDHAARAGGTPRSDQASRQARAAWQRAQAELAAPTALDALTAAFGLSPFERDVLLLGAGMELEAGFASHCAAAQGDPRRNYPTLGLALAALPEAHWSALVPSAPLRRWRLIELEAGDTLTTSRLRIDERVLHYLAGVPCLDERLRGLVVPLAVATDGLPPSHEALACRIADLWAVSQESAAWPVIQLCGEERLGQHEVAAAACARLRLRLHVLRASDVPAPPADRHALATSWDRESVLSGSVLLVDCETCDSAEAARTVPAFLDALSGLVFVSGRDPLRSGQRITVRFDVPRPTTAEQQALWETALGPLAGRLNGQIQGLVTQFRLGAAGIRAASAAALGGLAQGEGGADPGRLLWDACRVQARPRLDDLAQRIEPAAGWHDLVLPEPQRQVLLEIATQVRHRLRVYETWGFGHRGARGLGIGALFAGPSGTGKTLAAEILAGVLGLDLYRIDLSQVVSKYIGETEKNLRRVFDAAEEGGAILLFDEADALFGKRTEVKDSHDRYANIEVSYLLQRMEAYRGLAILTTNLKSGLDAAFFRRLRFVVQFPFPDAAQRAQIWQRVFPPETPTEGLDLERLARLHVAGGNIRNIALHAAFLAAECGEPVRMTHVLRAARGEFAKLEKTLTEAEVGGWS